MLSLETFQIALYPGCGKSSIIDFIENIIDQFKFVGVREHRLNGKDIRVALHILVLMF